MRSSVEPVSLLTHLGDSDPVVVFSLVVLGERDARRVLLDVVDALGDGDQLLVWEERLERQCCGQGVEDTQLQYVH